MMYLSFYKGKGNWMDKIIKARTNGDVAHVEIVFSDGISFSSSQWDKGVRFKQIEYKGDDKWVLVPLHFSPEIEKFLRDRAELLAEMKIAYDWRGILGFMIGKKNPGASNKLFCSEICTMLCQDAGAFLHLSPSETSPFLLEAVAKERAAHME
jgi:hypothetical protein